MKLQIAMAVVFACSLIFSALAMYSMGEDKQSVKTKEVQLALESSQRQTEDALKAFRQMEQAFNQMERANKQNEANLKDLMDVYKQQDAVIKKYEAMFSI